jgi:eukaryotic-like serine/threonine-protein kinase
MNADMVVTTDNLGAHVTFSVGQTVGEYRVIGLIGAGGMGTVYKVQHVISDRIEAMKVILPQLTGSLELLERFLREIKLQARLSHPNIASLHNALHMDQQIVMIMEYVEGKSLHARLQEEILNPGESIDIALQTLKALAYAHAQGIVHRDIKPANIMLTVDGTVKLMDFGVARAKDQEAHLTRAGAAVGSLFYMSPEQVQGMSVDQRSDLYSLGVTLYEMTTGVKPITGDTSWAIMNGHMHEIPRAPAAVNPAINGALSLAILKALEKSPAERYRNASEFASVLEAVRSQCGKLSPQKTPVLEPRPQVARTIPQKHASAATTTVAPRTPNSTPPSGFDSNAQRFDPRQLERLKDELAVYVGPIAKELVKRAARKATSVQQLYEALSAEVPEGRERKKFLAGRPR